jgi:hypothetical protein
MSWRWIGLLALFLASGAWAQDDGDQDETFSMTREQWRARSDASKARIQEMRRRGISMIPPPDEHQERRDQFRRSLEDDTLAYGDIVTTDRGMFQFVGKPGALHRPEDFRSLSGSKTFPQP